MTNTPTKKKRSVHFSTLAALAHALGSCGAYDETLTKYPNTPAGRAKFVRALRKPELADLRESLYYFLSGTISDAYYPQLNLMLGRKPYDGDIEALNGGCSCSECSATRAFLKLPKKQQRELASTEKIYRVLRKQLRNRDVTAY